jgi:undecaprenyl-diphosphatase
MLRTRIAAASRRILQKPVPWIPILIAFVALSAAFGFVNLTSEVFEGELETFDHFVLQSLRQSSDPKLLIGPTWLIETVRDISALGSVSVLTLVTLSVAGFCAIKRRLRLLVFFLSSVLGGTAVMLTLKYVIARPRPDIVPMLSDVTDPSYPSGHSMISAIVYLTLGALLARSTSNHVLKVYYLLASAVLTFLVGCSRVYLGVHYPTDVLAGWAAGASWSALTYFAASILQRRKAVEPETDSP